MVKLYQIIFWISVVCIYSMPQLAIGQDGTFKGQVKAQEDGTGLPGVNVLIKGTGKGAVTDFDGNFTLQAGIGAVLEFRFIGYETKTFTIKDDKPIKIKLSEATKNLKEAVVVGYGTQRREELTGSISSLKGSQITDMPTPSFEAAIQGKAPGVQVTVGSGLAGSASIVRIRGVSSLSAGGDPLYVIDGIPITQDYNLAGNRGGMNVNPLATINPEDIATIEILKDAAANAVYGSRGANGVIIITTKRGKKKGISGSVTMRVGTSEATQLPEVINNQQYLQLYQEAWENDGNVGPAVLPNNVKTSDAEITNTDWVRKTTQLGIKRAISGQVGYGTEKFNVMGILSYDKNESYLKGNFYERNSIRINADYRPVKGMTIALSSSGSVGNNSRVNAAWSGGLGAAMSTALPIYPVRNPDGTYFTGAGVNNNPVMQSEQSKWRTQETRTINSLNFNYNVYKGLNIGFTSSIDYMNLIDDQWQSNLITNNKTSRGSAQQFASFVTNFNQLFQAGYDWKLGENNNFKVLAAYEFQRSRTQRRDVNSNDVSAPFYTKGIFNAGSSTYDSSALANRRSSLGSKWAFEGYLAKFNYNYKEKYYVQASGRIDGSSRFGDNNRYGFFPALSGGWIISKEDFFQNIAAINFLKLKAGYGLSGNANISDDARFATYNSSLSQGGVGYNGLDYTFQIKLPNQDLKWETTTTFDVGVEIGLFNDRITLEADYYHKNTKDVLTQISIPSSIGFNSLYANVSTIENKGYEFGLKARPIVGDFTWTVDFNLGRNYNKIVSLGPYSEDAVSGGTNDTRTVPGFPVGANYLVRFSRVDQESGNPVYLDINGNETLKWDPKDRVPVGSVVPKAVGGITNTFTWKSFELGFLFIYRIGSDIYESSHKRSASVLDGGWSPDKRVFDRWQKPGDQAAYPRLTLDYRKYGATNANINTTFWLQDGTYARLRNLMLSYRFDNELLKRAKLASAKVTLSATNLLTFTNYTGPDPEVARDAEEGDGESAKTNRNLGAGNISFLTPPQERTYNVTITVGF